MYYYRIGDKICCSFNGNLSYEKAEMPHPGTPLTFLFEREPGTGRESFKVNSPLLLFQEAENVSWLSSRKLEAQAETMKKKLAESTEKAEGSGASESGAPAKMNCELDEAVKAAIDQGMMRAVNRLHPDFETILAEKPQKTKKRVHVLAIGDVGSTLLTGLHLLGGDCISSIGICDISDKVTARWEFEENQIAYPWSYDALPEVDVVKPEDLFKCDVFVFVASKGIPPVGSGVKDVRMYQFENNSKIVAQYARQARAEHFKGLFAVVSDPVDPLAKTAWLESNKDENGILDLKGLRPEQVQGFGLGVMNARAAYYAKRDERFSQFLIEGRSFGPHGQDLVIADSIENYNDELSKELTQLTVTANLHMRAIGFKPFIAPAYSSGAISLILMMRGEWHCGSVFMGGIFMGVKNRYTEYGLETEILPLPDALYERIVTAEENLKKIV